MSGKIIGISASAHTLTDEMGVKLIIALFMGLVLQFSQMQWASGAAPAKSCGEAGQAMSCCDGLQSCPCVEESDPEPKQAPLIPAAADLKLSLPKLQGIDCVDALVHPPKPAKPNIASRAESRSGYAGVPFAVAFCCFVI